MGKVVSLSLGGYYYSSISEAFYEKLYEEQGILFVAAAGNGGNSNKLYPASYPSLMSVAAIDSNKNRASFSTFNDQVEISAPGVSIESSLPGNRYAKWSGTSMATPHVAGVAGLLWMYFQNAKIIRLEMCYLPLRKIWEVTVVTIIMALVWFEQNLLMSYYLKVTAVEILV